MDMDTSEVTPDVLLPIQVGDRQFEGARLQPEKRLQLAVLVDALRIRGCLGAKSIAQPIVVAEVDEWFAVDDADAPFSFMGICDSLNLDPAYIRSAVPVAAVPRPDTWRLFLRRDSGLRTHVVGPRLSHVA